MAVANTDSIKRKILEASEIVAVVGLSSNPHKAGYYVPRYLQGQGYRIIPVNPNLDEALGETAYPSLEAVPEDVDLVLVFRLSHHVPPVVDGAIAIGADAIWLQLGIRHDEAAAKATAAGLDVVQDACMMVDHRALAA